MDGSFQKLTDQLVEHQLKSAKRFCKARGLPFNKEAFRRQASTDLDAVAKEMLMLGAGHFPNGVDRDVSSQP